MRWQRCDGCVGFVGGDGYGEDAGCGFRHSVWFSRGHRQPMALIFACLTSWQVPDHRPFNDKCATGVWVLSVVMGMGWVDDVVMQHVCLFSPGHRQPWHPFLRVLHRGRLLIMGHALAQMRRVCGFCRL